MSKQSILNIAKKLSAADNESGISYCVSEKLDELLLVKAQNTLFASLYPKNIVEYSTKELDDVTSVLTKPQNEDLAENSEETPPESTDVVQEQTLSENSVFQSEQSDSSPQTDENHVVTEDDSKVEIHIPSSDELVVDNGLTVYAQALILNSINRNFCLYCEAPHISAVACAKKGKSFITAELGIFALLFPYQPIDQDYIVNTIKKIQQYQDTYGCAPQVIFFQNRGAIITADTENELNDAYNIVTETIYDNLTTLFDDNPYQQNQKQLENFFDRIADLYCGSTAMIYHSRGIACSFCGYYGVKVALSHKKSSDTYQRPFIEEAKKCYERPLLFAEFGTDFLEKEFEQYVSINKTVPQIIIVKGLGFFTVDVSDKYAEALKTIFLKNVIVGILATNFGGARFLPKEKPIPKTEYEAPQDTQAE